MFDFIFIFFGGIGIFIFNISLIFTFTIDHFSSFSVNYCCDLMPISQFLYRADVWQQRNVTQSNIMVHVCFK